MADPSGKSPSEEDAKKEACHDNADGAATLAVLREIRRDGDHDMGDRSEGTGDRARGDQPEDAGGEGDEQESDGDGAVHAHHQGATLENVAKGDEAEEAAGVADLGSDRDEAGEAFGGVVGPAHVEEQWLIVVDGGHADSTGKAEEWERGVLVGRRRHAVQSSCLLV